MADDELAPAPTETTGPTAEPETPEVAPEAAASEPTSETPAAAAVPPFPAEQFAAAIRERVLTANYGVSAGVGVTCVQRGDGGLLLIFEAKEAAEALQAASAALATVPDDDTRLWRFAGSGPDLETGRARAVVRISRPTAAPAQ